MVWRRDLYVKEGLSQLETKVKRNPINSFNETIIITIKDDIEANTCKCNLLNPLTSTCTTFLYASKDSQTTDTRPWSPHCQLHILSNISNCQILRRHIITARLPPPQALLRYSFSKTPPCPTLKNGRQPAKRLPENVRFTASLLPLAPSNSSSKYISQTSKNSGEILKQLDSQGISFFISINTFGKSFADIHKKANWLWRIEWHLCLSQFQLGTSPRATPGISSKTLPGGSGFDF